MVTRCICCDISFQELKKRAQIHGATTPDELRAVARFGEKCGLCVPYVETMLQNGETAFWTPPNEDAEYSEKDETRRA